MKKFYNISILLVFFIITSGVKAQCSVFFTSVTTSVAGAISFTATSFSSILWTNNYSWSFGDGNNGYGSTPTNTYSANGSYIVTVWLYAYDPLDSTQYCNTQYSDTVFVSNTNPAQFCNSNFVLWQDSLNQYAYYGYNLSTGSVGMTYLWSFGDGTSSTQQYPQHTYTSTGVYNVCLTVSDSINSCIDTHCDSAFVSNTNPAQFCNSNFVLWQDSLNQYAYYGYNLSTGSVGMTYLWSFGDGTSSTQQYPQHTYTSTGVYNVCLTVSDSINSCIDTHCDSAGVFRIMTGVGMNQLNILNSSPTSSIIENIYPVSMNIFPNPVSENSQLIVLSEKNFKATINILNVLGEIVSTESQLIAVGKNNIQLKTNNIAPGTYFLCVFDGDKNFKNIKLIK